MQLSFSQKRKKKKRCNHLPTKKKKKDTKHHLFLIHYNAIIYKKRITLPLFLNILLTILKKKLLYFGSRIYMAGFGLD